MFSKKTFIVAFVALIALVSINFYEAKFALTNNIKYFRIGVMSIGIFSSLPFFFIKKGGLIFYIQGIALSIVFSMFICHYTWGQSYIDCVKATIPFMSWFFFFFLLKQKVNINSLEEIAIALGVLYMILFFFQYFNPGTVYFGYKDQFREDRGVIRILFAGGGFLNLALFISLNKFTTTKSYKYIWLAIVFLGLTVTVLQVTRQAIVAVVLVCVFHLMIKQTPVKKMITGLVLIIASFFFVSSENNFLNKLFNQDNQNNSVTKNIRLQTADYYINTYSPYAINKYLGNGIPYGEGTYYGLHELRMIGKGYYYTDIGIVAVYTFFGILPVLALILLYIKCFTIWVPSRYLYLKYYVFYLLFTIFTSDSCFNYGFLIANIFVFYGIQYYYFQKKEGIKVTITTTYI